ncbi:PREDICTED: probable pectinesterase/pectinesterase inhibitor 51 isoform X2 [Lupinus angustifolius]|uniref:probable pectinesterase/pectinesterase inhibitor 51 isoform X2 n=1 Tax=Lupinus angustifolius TaxID=3871 RepID=UPI00092F2A9E|nr:PREDICTED: probable pectinesterase/pectinesterase inhibitor 51 isoform X2 [Lupinus angustifolius]
MSSFYLLSFLLFLTLSSATNHHYHHHAPKPSPFIATTATPAIQQACKATHNPLQCESSLSQSSLPPNPTSLQLLQAAMALSSTNLATALTMLKSLLDASADSKNRTVAATTCLELLHNSNRRISLADESLPRGKTKDARAWLSAALAYTYDCWNSLKYANDTKQVGETMSFLDSLSTLNSNALSMAFNYDAFGNDTASWKPPTTERDGFWGTIGSGYGSRPVTEFPDKSNADVTVCKGEESGCLKTVQEAVNKAPDNVNGGEGKRFVIYIKEGVYKETVRVPLEKGNVVFLGDGMGKTVITGSANVGVAGMTTYNSATVAVLGDGFMAKDLTIENTAGPDAHQAVAFRLDSDLSIIENCEFLGNQDTLYAHSLRQFYKSCHIEGNVDFIFGNSASVFQDCQILVRPRQVKPEKGENNAVTAHGRTDPAQATGFVFQNCLINGTEEYMALYHSKPTVHKNFLGRPWKMYSRTVFLQCQLEVLVTPQGWMPWDGDFALKTLYYGEFENSGPGSDLSQRVPWSSKIPAEHVLTYSAQNFIQGDDWIPSSQLSSAPFVVTN